jgi:hypothetical protein
MKTKRGLYEHQSGWCVAQGEPRRLKGEIMRQQVTIPIEMLRLLTEEVTRHCVLHQRKALGTDLSWKLSGNMKSVLDNAVTLLRMAESKSKDPGEKTKLHTSIEFIIQMLDRII